MKRISKAVSLFLLAMVGVLMLSGETLAADKLNLQLKVKEKSVVLQWNAEKKVKYSVYKRSGKGKFIKLTELKGKKYTDKAVKSGEAYTYYVSRTDGKRIKSEQRTTVYLAPPVIKNAEVADGSVILKWKKTKGADSYAVYRKEGTKKAERIGISESEEFTDNTAQTGTVYTYTVKAVKGESVSRAAAVEAGSLHQTELISVKKSANGLTVSWKKADKADEYIIYRKKDGSEDWEMLDKVSSVCSAFEDKTVSDGEKYSYYVKTVSGYSISLYEGNEKSAVCLKAPSDFTLKKNGKKIKLSWSKKEGASVYQIYKRTGSGKWKKLKETDKLTFTEKIKNEKNFVSYKVRALKGKEKTAFSEIRTNRDVDPTKPMVALTYDDGPHPVNTHRILDVLGKYGARATFFVVGSRITEYKDCLKRQTELGCEVANHSFSHVTLSVSKNKIVLDEIEKTDKLIEKYSGQKPALCRAPGGAVGKAATLVDKPFIQWSVDTLDWKTLSSKKVVSHIKKTVRDGSIILMHDLYGSTAAASEIIIPWLIAEGYQLVTVSELLDARAGGAEGGRIYYNGYA